MIKKKRDTVKMIILLFAITLTGCGKQTEQPKDPYYILVEKNIKTNFTGSFRRNFNDMNDDHISVAVAKGIAPVDSVAALRQLADSARLEKVETCEYYKIDSLTHSHPYLVPSAKTPRYDRAFVQRHVAQPRRGQLPYNRNQSVAHAGRYKEASQVQRKRHGKLCALVRYDIRHNIPPFRQNRRAVRNPRPPIAVAAVRNTENP